MGQLSKEEAFKKDLKQLKNMQLLLFVTVPV